jgi:hypothetical protein
MALEDQFNEDDIQELERRFAKVEYDHRETQELRSRGFFSDKPYDWGEDMELEDFGW